MHIPLQWAAARTVALLSGSKVLSLVVRRGCESCFTRNRCTSPYLVAIRERCQHRCPQDRGFFADPWKLLAVCTAALHPFLGLPAVGLLDFGLGDFV